MNLFSSLRIETFSHLTAGKRFTAFTRFTIASIVDGYASNALGVFSTDLGFSRWIWVIPGRAMRGEVEGKLFIRTWSLKHEGLLGHWPERFKPISIWTSTFYVSHRAIEKLDIQFPVSRTPALTAPDLAQKTERANFRIWWGPPGQPRISALAAASSSKKVGNNAGRHWWFLCPSCARRVSALYFGNPELACRRCQGFVYQSEKLSRKERAMNRQLLRGIPLSDHRR